MQARKCQKPNSLSECQGHNWSPVSQGDVCTVVWKFSNDSEVVFKVLQVQLTCLPSKSRKEGIPCPNSLWPSRSNQT